MKKLIIIASLLTAFSFTTDNGHHKSIPQKSDLFTVDNVGNVYVVVGDEIRKYKKTGELWKIFSNKRSGKIFSIDASNALRVLVFYKDQSQIVILDSQLTQNGDAIELLDMGLEQSDLICTSFNNGMWLYNRQNAELVRLDQTLNKIVSTGNLNNLLNTQLKPMSMIENNGYVYLNDANNGILVFDIYGTYYKTISLFGLNSFQVSEQQVYYYKDSVISSYNSKLLSTYDSTLSAPYPKDVKWLNGVFYKQYADSIVWDAD